MNSFEFPSTSIRLVGGNKTLLSIRHAETGLDRTELGRLRVGLAIATGVACDRAVIREVSKVVTA